MEPLGLDTYLSASFAAAMAREGVGLAFTYRSCRIMRDEFRYLQIGKDGIFLDLALAWPAGKYRSRAAMALAKLFQEMAPELAAEVIFLKSFFQSIKNSRPAIHFIVRGAAALLTIFTQSKPVLPLQSEEWSGRISSVRGLRTQRPSHLPSRSRNASQAAADRYRRHGR